jgi:excisionase family DNA binding protein
MLDRLLLRPEEAARALGIGRSKLFLMLATGELPVVRIGRSTRIPTAALQHWVEQHTVRALANPSGTGDPPPAGELKRGRDEQREPPIR